MPIESVAFFRCQCGRIHFADDADFDLHRLFWTHLETLEFEEMNAAQIAEAIEQQRKRRKKAAA